MRTTLDLPDGLVEHARAVMGFKSKTDTVIFALREVVRRGRVDDLKELMTKIRFEFDPTEIRRRERPSVWVEAQRHPAAGTARTLFRLLDADEVALALPVRLELWAGTPRAARNRLARAFTALPLLVPTEETWGPLDAWIARAADAGQRFAVTDLLIARLADEIGGLVWSLDDDFKRLERLKLVSLYD
jgi:predicted nucleic acid-binding protein